MDESRPHHLQKNWRRKKALICAMFMERVTAEGSQKKTSTITNRRSKCRSRRREELKHPGMFLRHQLVRKVLKKCLFPKCEKQLQNDWPKANSPPHIFILLCRSIWTKRSTAGRGSMRQAR